MISSDSSALSTLLQAGVRLPGPAAGVPKGLLFPTASPLLHAYLGLQGKAQGRSFLYFERE